MSPRAQKFSKEWRESARDLWAKEPWSSFVSDRNGQAEVVLESTALDRTRGKRSPPSDRDINGKPFLFKVKGDKGQEEVLNLLIIAGESVKGTRVKLIVIEVREPIYTDTSTRP